MLTRVTITGADDRTDPRDLVLLSREFPFVEWGILHSLKRLEEPRYPSLRWRDAFANAFGDETRARASIHLCGLAARNALAGELLAWPAQSAQVHRVQLNGWMGIDRTAAFRLQRWTNLMGLEFILQCGAESDLQRAAENAAAIGSASVLFDPSGGRGIESGRYPLAPDDRVCVGYAGGIGPDNVLDVLDAIGPRRAPFWIDMESAVRTDDALDLDKARRVLELCAPRIGAA